MTSRTYSDQFTLFRVISVLGILLTCLMILGGETFAVSPYASPDGPTLGSKKSHDPHLRARETITSHFRIPSSAHLEPIFTRKILNVGFATPAVLLPQIDSRWPKSGSEFLKVIISRALDLQSGIVGLALHLTARHVGDPAKLIIRAVHPSGPAARAGLTHGEEIYSVNGASLIGKTYQEVIMVIRGKIGSRVQLGLRGPQGERTVTLIRVSENILMEHIPQTM